MPPAPAACEIHQIHLPRLWAGQGGITMRKKNLIIRC